MHFCTIYNLLTESFHRTEVKCIMCSFHYISLDNINIRNSYSFDDECAKVDMECVTI